MRLLSLLLLSILISGCSTPHSSVKASVEASTGDKRVKSKSDMEVVECLKGTLFCRERKSK